MILLSGIKANQEQNSPLLYTDQFNKSLILFGVHVEFSVYTQGTRKYTKLGKYSSFLTVLETIMDKNK